MVSTEAWVNSVVVWADSTAVSAGFIVAGWGGGLVASIAPLPLRIRALFAPRPSLTGPSSTVHSSSTGGLLTGVFSSTVAGS